jgi:VanZ family protein
MSFRPAETAGFGRWLWPVALAGAIFYASSQSRVAAPDVSGLDKISHFTVFAWLALLLARCPRRKSGPLLGFGWAVTLTALYGLADEVHQSFTPGRSVEIADWVADTLGALAGAGLYLRVGAVRSWAESRFWNRA